MKFTNLFYDENLIASNLIPCDSVNRISLKDNFFTKSAVLFSIIPYEKKPYELILIHRTNRGTRHRGEMSFPGGKYDHFNDNSLKDTALREAEEEIGIDRKKIKIIGCLDDFPTMTKYIITPFIGIINKEQRLVRQESEVQKILKIPIEFFVNKHRFREQAINIEDRKFPIFYFNYYNKLDSNTYTIWGATAYMIVNFIERVYGYSLSKLGIERFKLEKIKHLKEYIKYRNKITKNF